MDYRFIVVTPTLIKQSRAARYSYWHYSFDFGDGVVVKANLATQQQFQELNRSILDGLIDEFVPDDISTVLDVACSSAFHTLALAKRGWKVKGIDTDPTQIYRARLVLDCLGSGLDLQVEVGDFLHVPIERFDLVHCSGLLYHLKDVYGCCQKIYESALKGAVIQSCVDGYEGAYMRISDHESHVDRPFNGDYEFAFVPTMEALARIFREVGFREVRGFRAMERIGEVELEGLSPVYQKMMRDHTAYFALTK